jgi:hypothetical protein
VKSARRKYCAFVKKVTHFSLSRRLREPPVAGCLARTE